MNGDSDAGFDPCQHRKRKGKSDAMMKHAVLELLSDVSQATQPNLDVTIGWTGFKPNRNSHLANIANWTWAAFLSAFASKHLGAIWRDLNHTRMASDLRIPGAANHVSKNPGHKLARHRDEGIPAAEEIADFEKAWNGITDTFGRARQAEHYRLSLGITN